jgi:Ras family
MLARQVAFEEGLELAKANNINFFEVSAIERFNIREAFSAMAS